VVGPARRVRPAVGSVICQPVRSAREDRFDVRELSL
jgi:hypothetical protein